MKIRIKVTDPIGNVCYISGDRAFSCESSNGTPYSMSMARIEDSVAFGFALSDARSRIDVVNALRDHAAYYKSGPQQDQPVNTYEILLPTFPVVSDPAEASPDTDKHELMLLVRDASTLLEDMRNGYQDRDLHMRPDDWHTKAEALFNRLGDTLTGECA